MINEKYLGIFPAFYACYDDHGDISPQRAGRFAAFLAAKGVKGLYVGGSSGECIYQNVAERKQVLEAVMDAVGGKLTVIVHVGASSTRDSADLAAHARACGVDAMSSIPPIYFKLSEAGIERYWSAMIEAGQKDFIIYNIPQTTGYNLSMNLFRKMLANPLVIGVKNSSMPTLDIQQFKVAGGESFVIFNGPDEQFVGGRIMGADSGIGGTYGVMPELFLAADAAIRRGDIARATSIQNDINEIIFKLCGYSANLYAVAKEVLRHQGVDIGGARPPLEPVSETDRESIRGLAARIAELVGKHQGEA